MKSYIIAAIAVFTGFTSHAQWYNDGATTNAGATLSDWTVQATNTATGSYSTAGSSAPSSYTVYLNTAARAAPELTQPLSIMVAMMQPSLAATFFTDPIALPGNRKLQVPTCPLLAN